MYIIFFFVFFYSSLASILSFFSLSREIGTQALVNILVHRWPSRGTYFLRDLPPVPSILCSQMSTEVSFNLYYLSVRKHMSMLFNIFLYILLFFRNLGCIALTFTPTMKTLRNTLCLKNLFSKKTYNFIYMRTTQ